MAIPRSSKPHAIPSVPVPLGPFDLIEPIGAGGMATVWRGVHRDQQHPVAVKVITAQEVRGDDQRQAFRNEVWAVAGLDHPNVIEVFDLGEVSEEQSVSSLGILPAGCPFLVMEYARGGPLSAALSFHKWFDARQVLLALLDALAHAHAHNVIHLDIKPENVLLSKDRQTLSAIKLTDFGIAHAFDRPARAQRALSTSRDDLAKQPKGVVAGTPFYMAPEQFVGDWRSYGPWTDLYAVGCMAYELISGTTPFHSTSFVKQAQAHFYENVPTLIPRMAVPEGLTDWIMRLLEKEPGKRFQRAADAAWSLLRLTTQRRVGGSIPGGPNWRNVSTQRYSSPFLPGVRATALAALDTDRDLPTESHRTPSVSIETVTDELLSNFTTLRFEFDATHLNMLEPETSDRNRSGGDVPPLPRSWRPRPGETRAQPMSGVGLGLYDLRAIPMVGRKLERETLWQLLHEVHQGARARCLLMSGPIGSGKRRLAQWFTVRGHEVGAVTVTRAIHSPGGGPGEGMAPMLLRHLRCVGLDPDGIRSRIQRILFRYGETDPKNWEALADLLIQSPVARVPGIKGVDGASGSLQADVFDALSRTLLLLARERTLVIWLEDAQYGLEGLEFVRHFLASRTMGRCRVLFLLTLQDEELDKRPDESALVRQLQGLDSVSCIRVGPLSFDHHQELVRRLLGLSTDLSEEVARRTQGAPLFAVHLIRDWVQRDILQVSDRGFILKPDVKLELPDELHQVWLSRLQRVLKSHGPGGLEALEISALLGGHVEPVEWRHACRRAEIPAPDGLLGLLEAHQLIEFCDVGPAGGVTGVWTFLHAMLREALVRTADENDRLKPFHRACAEALQALYPSPCKEVAIRIGRHYHHAAMLAEALSPLLRASRLAEQHGEYAQSQAILNLWERTISSLDPPETDARWAEGWLVRISVLQMEGRLKEGLDLARRIDAWAVKHHRYSHRAASLQHIGSILEKMGQVNAAFECNRLGLSLYQELSDRAGMATCLQGLVSCAREAGRSVNAVQVLEQARSFYQEANLARGVADCELALGTNALTLGALDEANNHFSRALHLFSEVGEQRGRGEALRGRSTVALGKGKLETARGLLQQALALFERIGTPIGVGNCISDLGDIQRWEGNLSGAEQSYRRAIELFDALGNGGVWTVRFNLALAFLSQQQFERANLLLGSCVGPLSATGRKALLYSVHGALLVCVAFHREWEQWEPHLCVAQRVVENASIDRDDLWPLQLAGDLAYEAGELQKALQVYTVARTLRQRLAHLQHAKVPPRTS